MTLGEFIASSRQAEVFAWDDGSTPRKVLKLFFPHVDPSSVQWEFDIARTVSSNLPATPAVFGDIMEWDGRPGIMYERVDGASMLDVLASKPWRVRSLGRRLAEIQAEVHRSKPQGMPLLKDRLERKIGRAGPLSEDQKSRCVRLLESLPDGEALFHGDFHPGNIILRSGNPADPVVIDWPNSAAGDPLADVAQTRMILTTSWRILPRRRDRFLARWLTSFLNRWYTARYCELTGASLAGITRWQTVIAAARFSDNIPQERKQLLEVVRAGLAQA